MKPVLFMAVAVGVSAWGQAVPRPINPAVKEAVTYLLTADKLDKYAHASRRVTALIARDPSYENKMLPDSKDAPRSVDQTVDWTRSHLPAYFAAVEKAGIPFREYIVFQACLIITMEAYKRPQYAAAFHVRRENIAFIQANRLKIQTILAEQRRQPASPLKRGTG